MYMCMYINDSMRVYTERRVCTAERIVCIRISQYGALRRTDWGCIHIDTSTSMCPTMGYSYEWSLCEWSIHSHSYMPRHL